MNPVRHDTQFEHLYEILLPVLADAAVGRFEVDVLPRKDASWEFNKMLVGVQVLLEVIRQQQEEIQSAQARALDAQRRTTDILSRVLESSSRPVAFDSDSEM